MVRRERHPSTRETGDSHTRPEKWFFFIKKYVTGNAKQMRHQDAKETPNNAIVERWDYLGQTPPASSPTMSQGTLLLRCKRSNTQPRNGPRFRPFTGSGIYTLLKLGCYSNGVERSLIDQLLPKDKPSLSPFPHLF